MEDKNRNVCDVCGSGMDGRCGKCGHACGFGGRHILRWILGIIIIFWVFSIGMKIGEFKSALEGNSPYYYSHIRYGGMPMMYGSGFFDGSSDVIFTQSMPSAGTVTVPAKK